MSHPVITILPENTLRYATEKMQEFDISSLVATSNGRPIGIVTKRDFLESITQIERVERRLTIQFSVRDVEIGEIQRRNLRAEIDEKNQRLQTYINSLVGENLQLKHRIQSIESAVQASQIMVHTLESEKTSLAATVNELKQRLSLLNEVAIQMQNLKMDMELRKKEELVKYVIANAPTDEELTAFMNRKHIARHLLKTQDMQCIWKEDSRWLHNCDLDEYNLGSC